MDINKKDMRFITHILEYCEEVEQTVERFGDSLEVFSSDKIYRNAVTMCILQIGELTGRLSDEFTNTHNQIPWRSIRAMRNIAAHAYVNISIPDVWETVVNDIPKLKSYCQNVLSEN